MILSGSHVTHTGCKLCLEVFGNIILGRLFIRIDVYKRQALGAGLQNIVTRSERDAREAISYLKQHRGGRVTLLPLDALRPKKNSAMERALGLPLSLIHI